MSDYDYGEPRRYRTTRTRPRERGDPEFVQETTYVERGKGPPPRDLVYRPREDSVEDIPRDFPPPGGDRYGSRRYDNYAPPRRARSVGRRDYHDDDGYSDYAAPAAAAAAGYGAARSRGHRDRRSDRRDRDYDSEDYQSPRRHRERRKSGVGEVLEGLGLGGVAAALTGGRSRSRSRNRRDKSRGRHQSSESSRSRTRSRSKGRSERKWAQAAQAALVAGAVEAFRSRKEPGSWTGDKGRRIATAAISAGGIDGLVDRDPERKTKRHLAEAVIGGLAANRLANGPRNSGRDGSPYSGRSRSRSRSVFGRGGRSQSRGRDGGGGGAGGLEKLAAGGALAAAGKAIYDRVRSKSRRRRSPSSSSADSYVPSRNRRRNNGQARSLQSDTGAARGDRGRTPNDRALPAAAGTGAGALAARNGQGQGQNRNRSQSSSSSSTDIETKRKHMRGKELITAGLATVATIHAAHGVYSSMEAHEKRHKLVAEGEMSPEEARKKQTKAWVQDAAAVGIAALGIKGAFSEWKEMNEHRYVWLAATLQTSADHDTGVKFTSSRNASATRTSVRRSVIRRPNTNNRLT